MIPIDQATVLWIEADPVFGGSSSQIQFPVELSAFFGLPQNPSIGDETELSVMVAGIEFPPKKIDFHHNGMWRLNLPTARQGLGGYRGKLLVFERTTKDRCYRLLRVDLDEPFADELRRSAEENGSLGETIREDGRPREYGSF